MKASVSNTYPIARNCLAVSNHHRFNLHVVNMNRTLNREVVGSNPAKYWMDVSDYTSCHILGVFKTTQPVATYRRRKMTNIKFATKTKNYENNYIKFMMLIIWKEISVCYLMNPVDQSSTFLYSKAKSLDVSDYYI